jgi:ribosomal peptide maturation radical SAM protein 1
LVLLSAPWPLFDRPSIAIAALKAFIQQRVPLQVVAACHWHLPVAAAIGYETYAAISHRTWAAESVYAALLFPEKIDGLADFFHRQSGNKTRLKAVDFRALVGAVARCSRQLIGGVGWHRFGMAGFSIGLCQLSASLYFIRQVKAICPALPVVVGGSTITEATAKGLLTLFPTIDFAVCGEGETPLVELLRGLEVAGALSPQGLPPGVLSGKKRVATLVGFNQVPDLGALPVPDFDEYFNLLADLPSDKRFFPVLPLEMSRGCFWQSARGKGCAFCNLNQQWHGFRKKAADQIVAEVQQVTRRHQTLAIAYTDNALPLGRHGRRIYRGLAGLPKDLQLFGEIKATISRTTLQAMKAAGFCQVQIGIESLSSRLLAKINKGTSAMDNIAVLKYCQELGIGHISNLILHLPGSDETDVAETLANLSFVLCFQPLKPTRFWLGLGSPIHRCPGSYGLLSVFNHPYWGRLFPPTLARNLVLGIQGYKGDLVRQRRLWSPVRRQLILWQKAYETFQRQEPGQPVLSRRDGGEFLILRQRRLNQRPATHRLNGPSRRIYLFCDEPRALAQIYRLVPRPMHDKVIGFLSEMVAKKLMFAENGRYLSLAVPACRH